MDTLKIGQIATASGVSREAIRYYEREGLVAAPERLPNGYRGYAPAVVTRLNFIKRAKGLGFSLKEVRDLLSLLDDANAGARDLKRRAEAKLAEIEAAMSDLRRMHDVLSELTEACPGRGVKDRCPIFHALVDDEK